MGAFTVPWVSTAAEFVFCLVSQTAPGFLGSFGSDAFQILAAPGSWGSQVAVRCAVTGAVQFDATFAEATSRFIIPESVMRCPL